MLEGAILTSIARTLHIEGTNSGLIPLVVGRHSCQALEHGMGSHLAIGKIFTILICLGILELIVATYPTVGQRHLVGSQLFEVFVSHLAPARARFFCPNKTASEQVHENCEKKPLAPQNRLSKSPTCTGRPYSKSKRQVWQTFFTLAQL